MLETNDEERQKKYEDKISLRTLLLRDIDRINKALLKRNKTGMEELENLLSDLPEDIYRSVLPKMNERTEKLEDEIERIKEGYKVTSYPLDGYGRPKEVRVFKFDSLGDEGKRLFLREVLKAKRGYVREVKKIIRWTMDEFGLGLEEEGKKIEEGGL